MTARAPTGCMVWKGTLDIGGYGRMRISRQRGKQGKFRAAHRVAWEHANACRVPRGRMVLHLCDNRACVNPDHLFLGTAQDNSSDMVAKGRSMRGEAHHKAKLSEADVMAIRQDGRSESVIAADYGVAKSTINAIRARRIWRWLTALTPEAFRNTVASGALNT